MVWCFAYGSNLDKNQMKDRIGDFRECHKALLRGWKLAFNVSSSGWGGKAANIIETSNPEDIVYGAVYQVTEIQLNKLAQKEGPPPRDLEVETQGTNIRARVYIFDPRASAGKPTQEYLNRILSGLQQHGYDQNVIDSVRKIADESESQKI